MATQNGYEIGEIYGRHLKSQLSVLPEMGTNTGLVMTLANSIIGVSVLAMPFCYKQCGIILASLMLIMSSIMSRLACYYLIKSAVIARRKNFEFLAFYTFGPTGKLTVELSIIGFMLGTCVAFFVVMGDLGPAILGPILSVENPASIRPTVLIAIAVCVVLPLGLLRNVDSLAAISAVTIAFYICLVLKVMGEATTHLLAWDWLDKVHLWRPAGLLQCIPIFSMALSCQTQLFELFDSMPNASIDKMNVIVKSAVNLCTLMYMAMGFFGYVAFCTQPFSGNLMLSFSPTPTSEVIKMGFVLSVAVSFPLVIFPCRASLHSLLFRRGIPPHYELLNTSNHMSEGRFKCITMAIVAVSLVTGIMIPNIELVLGLVGSTIGVLICVIIPATCFLCLTTKNNNERLLAQILFGMGLLIMVLGSYANLYATEEVIAGSEQSLAKVPLKDPELPVLNLNPEGPNNVKIKDDALKGIKNVQQLAAALPQLIDSKTDPPPPLMEEVKDKADVRKEPVVPEAPVVKVVSETAKTDVKEGPGALKELKVEQPVPAIDKVEPKKEEVIHGDAIKKEDDEIKEVQKQEILKKKEELIEKFEENEKKQQYLLEEQRKILEDIKLEKEKLEKEKIELKKSEVDMPIKMVKEEKLNVKNEVIGEEKLPPKAPNIERDIKQVAPKENLIVEKPANIKVKAVDMMQDNIVKKNIADGVPLPIAIQNLAPHDIVKPVKIIENPLNPNEGNVESKVRREILGENGVKEQREKRDIEEVVDVDQKEDNDVKNAESNNEVVSRKENSLPENKIIETSDKVITEQIGDKEKLATNNAALEKDAAIKENTVISTVEKITANDNKDTEKDIKVEQCADKTKSANIRFSDDLVPLNEISALSDQTKKEVKSSLKTREEKHETKETSESIVKPLGHLSNPGLVLLGDKLDSPDGVNILNNAAKPMKRDLKSLDMTQDIRKERET